MVLLHRATVRSLSKYCILAAAAILIERVATAPSGINELVGRIGAFLGQRHMQGHSIGFDQRAIEVDEIDRHALTLQRRVVDQDLHAEDLRGVPHDLRADVAVADHAQGSALQMQIESFRQDHGGAA